MVVHVGSMPLRARPGPPQWALLSADRLLSIQHLGSRISYKQQQEETAGGRMVVHVEREKGVDAMLQLGSRISYKQQQEEAAGGRMVVHVGSMPLRAPPGPPQWALLSADRLLSIQHFYTVLQPIPASPSEQHPCVVFDFQPRNPEDLFTVIVGLSGGAVPGVILKRTIMHPPVRRCWKVGMAKADLSMKDAAEFNRRWDCSLQLWKHDCRHHTNALVEFLTGEKEILRKLSML